jgi:branched-chain amino acid transport system substrate-binding protein
MTLPPVVACGLRREHVYFLSVPGANLSAQERLSRLRTRVTEVELVKRKRLWALLALLIAAFAIAAVGCGGDDDDGDGGAVAALPSASCGPIRYEGEGEPDALIASDFPLQGANRALTTEMADAVELVLKQRDWKAGDLNIGFQSCDDSTAQAGSWDSAKCSANARAYANNDAVIGIIGTFNSGCAKLVIPVLNRAPEGPVAMVSPSNTNPGLTESGPGADPGAPDVYYPTGTRNYARVVWNDQHQGAANALYTKELGLKNVFVVNDKQTYGLGIANLYRDYAEKLGIKIAGFQAWDENASAYDALASRVKASGADGVFLGGIICLNGGKLIKDLRATLGPEFPIIAPDGFTPISATIDGAGAAANGMYISQPGLPEDQLTGPGKKFVADFKAETGKSTVDPYTAYAAQAAVVLLDAVDRSDGTRASVAEELFNTDIKGGILGNFSIDENGDTTLGTVTFFQVRSGAPEFVKLITPEASFVEGS